MNNAINIFKEIFEKKETTELFQRLEYEKDNLEEEVEILLKNKVDSNLSVGKLLGVKKAIEIVEDLNLVFKE